jgi:pimeloyl-ACP methyl ester carboxylesterase
MEAAAAGVAIDKVAVYEVPHNVDDDWPQRWREYVDELGSLLAADRRGDAFALFMALADTPQEVIASARSSPMWPGLEAIAPTLAYDAACLRDGQPPTARLARITQPTLVATGGDGRAPGAARWVRALDPAADAIAASIPHAERLTIEGQGHVVDPKALGPVLEAFFGRPGAG